MTVNDRKLKILKVIIDDFIDTAQPVGSRTIAKKYPLGISSATIRNEMADLEELGYLIQPHTSAGRVPSDEGYRLYVDELMKQKKMGKNDRQLIRGLLLNKVIEMEDVIHKSAQLLAQMTDLIAFVTLPQFNKSKLTNMKMVKINDSKVMLILVADSGVVKSLQLAFKNATQEALDAITDVMMHSLLDSTIEDITVKKIGMIKNVLPQYANVIDYLVPILRDTLNELDDIDFYVEGLNNAFNFPEFQNVAELKSFIDIVQSKEMMMRIMSDSSDDGIGIRIGKEIGEDALTNCSIVSVCYKVNGKNVGRIGLIGPSRMDYSKVISVVDYIRETLSDIFAGIYL
ncbi:MAG: heat-inducible transcription repressor HrcA [Clostridia bacterium]|nr:heat-inducible transcription repressor HrcA [Clostridia bacterium]